MGRQVWAVHAAYETDDGMRMPAHIGGPYRVLSFQRFLPAEPPGPEQKRKKHLVQLWTDPGGMRTLNVGCLRLKDPGKVAAGRAAHETRMAAQAEARGDTEDGEE